MADYINLSSHGRICFANLHLKDLRCYGFNCIINPQQVFFESLISFCKRKTRYSFEYLVPLWQRYKDSNLKWRSQSLAIFFQNRLFKPFFRLCVSQKSLRILFLLRTANSYEELQTLHRRVYDYDRYSNSICYIFLTVENIYFLPSTYFMVTEYYCVNYL